MNDQYEYYRQYWNSEGDYNGEPRGDDWEKHGERVEYGDAEGEHWARFQSWRRLCANRSDEDCIADRYHTNTNPPARMTYTDIHVDHATKDYILYTPKAKARVSRQANGRWRYEWHKHTGDQMVWGGCGYLFPLQALAAAERSIIERCD